MVDVAQTDGVHGDFVYEGWDDLAEVGWTTDYVSITSEFNSDGKKIRMIRPLFTREMLEAQGCWHKAGDIVTYTGRGGSDWQCSVFEQYASASIGDKFTVKTLEIGRSSSSFEFEEFPNKRFNTCMFSRKTEQMSFEFM